jgi:hypothetical protein
MSLDAALYPSSDSKAVAGGARRRRTRSASPKRKVRKVRRSLDGGAKRRSRSASPKRKVRKARKSSKSPSRKVKKALSGGAKRAKKGTRYEALTLEQLQKKAKKYDVAYSGLKKSSLIRAIRSKKGSKKSAKKM